MEKDQKKKTFNFNGKQKIYVNQLKDDKRKTQKILETKTPFSKNTPMLLSYVSFNQIPVNIYELDNKKNLEKKKELEDNYYEIIFEKKQKIKKINEEMNESLKNKDSVINLLNEINKNIKEEEIKYNLKINEIINEKLNIEILKNELIEIEKQYNECEENGNRKKKIIENSLQNESSDILKIQNEIQQEKNNLTKMLNQNIILKDKIPQEIINLQKKEEELNEEKNKLEKQIEIKNELREQYNKINKIAINDNKFCHENFYSLLTFFPYYKNVAFISNNEIIKEEKKDESNINNINNMNNDYNRMIIDGEIEDEIENKNLKNIEYILNQKENSNKNVDFKILKDRRTLQINQKEKYKFKKIFSIINNNYIAEPWDNIKFNELKLSSINSYFNEFNMTAMSNNYFIIYFIQNLDKTSLNNEAFKLFQKLKNNEYIDKKIIIKISVITESNYINLQNINHESKVKNQLLSIINGGIHTIYGFLYEFTKTNRLNKKNTFRIYNFDYNYPQAIEMMNNINKYYAKKKRKKTGVYKKLNMKGGQAKQKKKQGDRSISNNNKNNNNNNKENKNIVKNNNINKKNNLNIIKNKKKTHINNNNSNNINNGILKKNKSTNIIKQNKKVNNNNINNNINNNKINKKADNTVVDDSKKVLKKSGSDNLSQKKDYSKNNLNINNNIKLVIFNEQEKNIASKKNNSENKKSIINKQKESSLVFNDLKIIKPEHTLIIHDINSDLVLSKEFKQIAKACGLLNNSEK